MKESLLHDVKDKCTWPSHLAVFVIEQARKKQFRPLSISGIDEVGQATVRRDGKSCVAAAMTQSFARTGGPEACSTLFERCPGWGMSLAGWSQCR